MSSLAYQAEAVCCPEVVLGDSVVPQAASMSKAIALEQQRRSNTPVQQESQAEPSAHTTHHFYFVLSLTVWDVEPVMTHRKSWLESTGVYGERQNTSLALWSVDCSWASS